MNERLEVKEIELEVPAGELEGLFEAVKELSGISTISRVDIEVGFGIYTLRVTRQEW